MTDISSHSFDDRFQIEASHYPLNVSSAESKIYTLSCEACVLIGFTALLFASMIGALSAMLFLASGGALMFLRRNHMPTAILRAWPWFLFATLAMASLAWSDYPMQTIRGSIQYILSIMIAAAMTTNIKSNRLFFIFSLGLLGALALGLVLGRTTIIYDTGEVAAIGVFGSKNALAQITGYSTIISFFLMMSPNNSRIQRIISVLLFLLSSFILISAKSLGGTVATFAAIGLGTCLLISASICKEVFTKFVIAIVAFCMIGALVSIFLSGELDGLLKSVLSSAGKDSTLTGRTYLWALGAERFEARPILGGGYQAFWVLGQAGAEELWMYAKRARGEGFHFHNQYVNIIVDLGLLGLLSLAICLGTMIVGVFRFALGKMTWEQAGLATLVLYTLSRTYLEVDFFYQFSVSQTILVIVTVFCVKGMLSNNEAPPPQRLMVQERSR